MLFKRRELALQQKQSGGREKRKRGGEKRLE